MVWQLQVALVLVLQLVVLQVLVPLLVLVLVLALELVVTVVAMGGCFPPHFPRAVHPGTPLSLPPPTPPNPLAAHRPSNRHPPCQRWHLQSLAPVGKTGRRHSSRT